MLVALLGEYCSWPTRRVRRGSRNLVATVHTLNYPASKQLPIETQ
jgi:hypothetical protein